MEIINCICCDSPCHILVRMKCSYRTLQEIVFIWYQSVLLHQIFLECIRAGVDCWSVWFRINIPKLNRKVGNVSVDIFGINNMDKLNNKNNCLNQRKIALCQMFQLIHYLKLNQIFWSKHLLTQAVPMSVAAEEAVSAALVGRCQVILTGDQDDNDRQKSTFNHIQDKFAMSRKLKISRIISNYDKQVKPPTSLCLSPICPAGCGANGQCVKPGTCICQVEMTMTAMTMTITMMMAGMILMRLMMMMLVLWVVMPGTCIC